MVDLAKVVEYERGFPVELTYPPGHPKAGRKVGITWWVTHQDSAAVKRVVGRHVKADRSISSLAIMGEDAPELPDEVYVDRGYEKVAATVQSWEWGVDEDGEPNTYKGEVVGECTYEKALEILKANSWIFGQVLVASQNLGNFTEASAKS